MPSATFTVVHKRWPHYSRPSSQRAKLVGKKTWGGLVGTLGFPVLMNGGLVTAPDIAIFTEEGWVVENIGIAPDIEVEQDPAAVAAGKDPQLDRAIEVALDALAKSPPAQPSARPPYPIRIRHQLQAHAATSKEAH